MLARKRALQYGRPPSITKRNLRGEPAGLLEKQAEIRDRHIPVPAWSRYRRLAGQRRSDHGNVWLEEQVPTDIQETEWTYDSGLLVCPDM